MAPKPMLMVSATGDWTKNTPKEEFPAMKAIYDLYGKGDQVETTLIDAPHNYNRASREAVYGFMAKHVLNDPDSSKYREKNIRQEKLQDMMVFFERPFPTNAVKYDQLLDNWVRAAKAQNDSVRDPQQAREYLTMALGTQWPAKVEHEATGERMVMTRPGAGDRVPGVWTRGKGGAVLIVHPDGAEAARKSPEAAKAIREGRSVLTIDAFQTGTAVAPRDRSHRYFLTFNRSDDANRVQDILTAIAFLAQSGESNITLVGVGKAAVWTTFAAAVSQHRVVLNAPLGTFKGEDQDFINSFFVPGIQRAGGLGAALRLTGGKAGVN
jgi:hypothetical protein